MQINHRPLSSCFSQPGKNIPIDFQNSAHPAFDKVQRLRVNRAAGRLGSQTDTEEKGIAVADKS